MPHSVDVELEILHTEKKRAWCRTCLYGTDQATIFMRIGKDGSSLVYCLEGKHKV